MEREHIDSLLTLSDLRTAADSNLRRALDSERPAQARLTYALISIAASLQWQGVSLGNIATNTYNPKETHTP